MRILITGDASDTIEHGERTLELSYAAFHMK